MDKLLKSETLNAILSTLLGGALSFITPIAPFIILTIFLVIFDTIAKINLPEVKEDTPSTMYKGLKKILIYFMLILGSEGLIYVFSLPIPVTYITSIWICITEFKFLVANGSKITGVPLFDKLKGLWKYIKDDK